METIRIRRLEEDVSRYRRALRRIVECEDAPNIDPIGDVEFGLHCGVEDRCASNRYEGANIGYAQGCEAALEWAVNEAKYALGEEQEMKEAIKEPPLPEGVDGTGGIYTKDNSDLFIERDMSPEDLRMIADHIEWSNPEREGIKNNSSAEPPLWQQLKSDMPWAYDEARVVNADRETLEYVLTSEKGFPAEIASIQLARNIWKLVRILNSKRFKEDPTLVSSLVDAKKEHADSMSFSGEL